MFKVQRIKGKGNIPERSQGTELHSQRKVHKNLGGLVKIVEMGTGVQYSELRKQNKNRTKFPDLKFSVT